MSDRHISGTVLVVDDDDRIRKFVTTALRRAGYDIAAAASGKEALRCLAYAVGGTVTADKE